MTIQQSQKIAHLIRDAIVDIFPWWDIRSQDLNPVLLANDIRRNPEGIISELEIMENDLRDNENYLAAQRIHSFITLIKAVEKGLYL